MKKKCLVISFALGLGMTLAVLGLAGKAAHANGDVLYVASAGCGGASPCYPTIQQAVDNATHGDEIRVATGVYTDMHTRTWSINPGYPYSITQMIFLNKDITIQGGYTVTNWSTADPLANPVTLDAQGQGRVFYITSGHSVMLEGLRMVNGWGWATPNHIYTPYSGGAIYRDMYDANGRLTVRNCDILSNTITGGDGGGIDIHQGTLILQDSRLMGNVGNNGGGLSASEAVVTITNNLFEGNVADGSGGGAYLYLYIHAQGFVADNTFQNNAAATNDGGGLVASWGELTLTRNTFISNTASGLGGGMYASVGLFGKHTYTITHNLIQGNVAGSNESNVKGGGARLTASDGGQIVFSHNRVLNNVALQCQNPTGWSLAEGGGVWLQVLDNISLATVSDNLIQDNWATNSQHADQYNGCVGSGGGVWVRGTAWLERNRIIGNRAAYHPDWEFYLPVFGGGVYIYQGSTVTMTNNIIADNKIFEQDDDPFHSDIYSDGGAFYIGGQTTPADTWVILRHNTIANNQSPAIMNESAAITMSHTIMAGHTTDIKTVLDRSGIGGSLPPTTVADYTLWYPAMNTQITQGSFAHAHDFTDDPDFVSTSEDSYHLGRSSAAINKGPGADVDTDIDGNPRPLEAGYDLGADEYSGIDLSSSYKSVYPARAGVGQVVTFTIVLRNSGSEDALNSVLFDAIPAATAYVPGSVRATSGVTDDTGGIHWQGDITVNQSVTLTFQVTVSQNTLIENTAVVTDTYDVSLPLTAYVNMNCIYLPLVMRTATP